MQGIHEQSNPCHQPDPTGYRCDRANDGFYGVKINVPDEFSVHAVNSDVKDDAPGFHHVSRNELGFADGCHQDVSTAAYLGEVGRAAVRQCDGRVAHLSVAAQQDAHWRPHDVASSHDHRMLALRRKSVVLEKQ